MRYSSYAENENCSPRLAEKSGDVYPGIAAVQKAPCGTGRDRFVRRRQKLFWVFQRDSMGIDSRLLPTGWGWYGKLEPVWLTGRDRSTRFNGGTGSWNSSGTCREHRRKHRRGVGREHSREHRSGTSSGIRSADAVGIAWEHGREPWLETTPKKRVLYRVAESYYL